MIPATPPAVIALIQGAPLDESPASIADRLQVSVATVTKYRAQAREIRQEAARAAIAADVEKNLPGALEDLAQLREIASKQYREWQDPKQGALWLRAILATLQHVRPEDGAEWANRTDEELEHFANTGEWPRRGVLPGPGPSGAAAPEA